MTDTQPTDRRARIKGDHINLNGLMGAGYRFDDAVQLAGAIVDAVDAIASRYPHFTPEAPHVG